MVEHIHAYPEALRLDLAQLNTKATALNRVCLQRLVSRDVAFVDGRLPKLPPANTAIHTLMNWRKSLYLMVVGFATAWFAPVGTALAQAGSFVDVLTRDPSTTNVQNRLCYATNGRVDIGCPTTAPYLNAATGFVGIGLASPTHVLDVSGSIYARGGLVVGRSTKSSQIWGGVDAATYISFHWGQPDLTFHTNNTRRMVIASSNFGAEYGGRVGIGNFTHPSTTLHVSGTLRLANGGEACDTNRLGSIRYASASFDICRDETKGWEPLATDTSATDIIINTGLSGSLVFRDELGTLKARDDFAISSTTGSIGIGAGAPNWLGNNGLYVSGTFGSGAGDRAPVISLNQIPLLHTFTATGAQGNNLFLGKDSGNFTAISASHNTGIGAGTLQSIATGKYNTALGWAALASSTLASYNTAIGIGAMRKNTAAGSSVATGAYSLYNVTSGNDNVAIGASALSKMPSSYRNTTIGAYTLYDSSFGSDNAVVGHASMQFKNGSLNSTLGKNAAGFGGGTITGTVAIGFEAGNSLTTNTSNTLVGYRAGANITAGSNNLMLGASTNALNPTGSGQLNIGNAVWGNIASGTGNANKIGINVSTPSTSLHVSGTFQFSNGGENCDINRLGAIHYTSGSFNICRNIINGWEPLATATSATDIIINTGLSGSLVFRDELGKLKARNDLSVSSTTGSIGIGGAAPASLGNNSLWAVGHIRANANVYGTIFSTNGATGGYYWAGNNERITGDANNKYINIVVSNTEALRIVSSGNVGINTPAPKAALDVSGAIKISGDGSEQCNSAADSGKIRINPSTGHLQICKF